jgi:hypothetical protein
VHGWHHNMCHLTAWRPTAPNWPRARIRHLQWKHTPGTAGRNPHIQRKDDSRNSGALCEKNTFLLPKNFSQPTAWSTPPIELRVATSVGAWSSHSQHRVVNDRRNSTIIVVMAAPRTVRTGAPAGQTVASRQVIRRHTQPRIQRRCVREPMLVNARSTRSSRGATAKEKDTTAPGRPGDRTYVNFTGFPFPLGPLLSRRTCRYEVRRHALCSHQTGGIRARIGG